MTTFSFRSQSITAENPVVYNARKKPFTLHGLYQPQNDGVFCRMPKEVAEKISERVTLLYTNTAGARLRFATDSDFIAVGAIYPDMVFPSDRTAALSSAGAFCFDLYADSEHVRVLWPEKLQQHGSIMRFDIPDGQYEAAITFPEKKMRQITVCFPSFVNISDVFIGLREDAFLAAAKPYKQEKPVVFYGSSITQGACACRSGNIYPNILSRRLDFDYLNLGFASACGAEDAAIDYLCALDMSLLVFDYDHNAPSAEYLKNTHLPALKKLRAAHPDVPIIALSKPNCHNGTEEATERANIIRESCRIAEKESTAPIHFISGQDIFCGTDKDMMTIDGTHPTDFGFYCMAEKIYDVMKEYFK